MVSSQSLDDFVADHLRAAVFTSSLQHLQVASVARDLLPQLSQFTGDPMILPIPADAPAEIPRIVLKDSTGASQLQVAPSRSDLSLARQPGSRLDANDFFEGAVETLEILLGALGVRPDRLAVTGAFFHRSDDPATHLATHFCQSRWVEGGPLADVRTFELHAHHRLEPTEGPAVNSWIRCKTGSASDAGTTFPAIIVERDINTLKEEAEGRAFDPDGLRNFMRQAGAQLSASIPEFFARSS